jgi:hypothetical protein
MAYKVGDKTTHCADEAKGLAASAHCDVTYMVGDKCYPDREKAMAALADETEAFVAKFVHVSSSAVKSSSDAKTCPMTGKKIESEGAVVYKVAGHTYDCPKDAERAAKLASEAMATVAMKYRVGEKDYGCSKSAGAMAKESHAPMMYVVGDECTPCAVTARLMLARMQVEAAERALDGANAARTDTSL